MRYKVIFELEGERYERELFRLPDEGLDVASSFGLPGAEIISFEPIEDKKEDGQS